MIRVNGRGYSDHNILTDNIVIDIKNEGVLSDETVESVIDALIQHTPIPENIQLQVYKRADKLNEDHYQLDMQIEEGRIPTNRFSDENNENLDDVTEVRNAAKEISSAFTKFAMNYVGHENDFVGVEISETQLLEQLQDALNIMPTLMTEDLSVKDKIKYSKIGQNLMFPDFMMEDLTRSENPFPHLDDIKLYDGLSAYEKQIVRNNCNFHPRYILDIYKGIQEVRPGTLLSNSVLRNASLGQNECIAKETELVGNAEDIEYMDTKFKEDKRFHGRSPRVLNELVSAIVKRDQEFSKEAADTYVEKFNLPAMQKIAKFHSPTLFAMFDKLNFAEVPDTHIEMFGSLIEVGKIDELEQKNFFKWYQKNKGNINVADMLTLINNIRIVPHLDPEKTFEEILFDATQNIARQQIPSFERKYHVRFLDNDVAIKGRNIIVSDDKYTVLILPADDARVFTVGADTNCCQHLGGFGENCCADSAINPLSAVTVIVKNSQMLGDRWLSGGAIAQAWTWVDATRDTIVFDNMEFARTGGEDYDTRIAEFNNVLAAFAEALPYQNFHIGTGCNSGMNGWGRKHKEEEFATLPWNNKVRQYGPRTYSDYHEGSARVIKAGGEMLIHVKESDGIPKVRESVLKASVFDAFNGYELFYGVTDSVSEDIALINEWREHPTDELKTRLYRENPDFATYMEEIPLDIQRDIVANHPNLISYIRNPLPGIYATLLERRPGAILNIENASIEDWSIAVRGNGLLLEFCPYRNEDLDKLAVEQNPIAVKFTTQTPAVQMAAVRKDPASLLLIREPLQNVIDYAVGRNPSILSTYNKKTVVEMDVADQLRLVRERPANILDMKNPPFEVVLAAVSLNGNLIRSFKGRSEELDIAAVRQNPFAIKDIPHPSEEVKRIAYQSNPRSLRYMRMTPQEKTEFVAEMEAER